MSRQVEYKNLQLKNGDKMMSGNILNYKILKPT